jgi:hypothetical protein
MKRWSCGLHLNNLQSTKLDGGTGNGGVLAYLKSIKLDGRTANDGVLA